MYLLLLTRHELTALLALLLIYLTERKGSNSTEVSRLLMRILERCKQLHQRD